MSKKKSDEIKKEILPPYKLEHLEKIEIEGEETRYAFPNSPMSYKKEDAEKILFVANYQGMFSDSMRIELQVKLIEEITAIKKHLGIE